MKKNLYVVTTTLYWFTEKFYLEADIQDILSFTNDIKHAIDTNNAKSETKSFRYVHIHKKEPKTIYPKCLKKALFALLIPGGQFRLGNT